MSLYIKTDGTKYVGDSIAWTNLDEARLHITEFISVLQTQQLTDELVKVLGFSTSEADHVRLCTVAALTRLVSQPDVESWVSEVLDILVLFNAQQMITRKASGLELFRNSYQLSSDIEGKRALGARLY